VKVPGAGARSSVLSLWHWYRTSATRDPLGMLTEAIPADERKEWCQRNSAHQTKTTASVERSHDEDASDPRAPAC
jgi:hypothetical protein